ncbi:hypothetical protein H257_04030 [Aphanomyces astaci]|uniref:Complex 1 LYR protein domain-containing protein n=2 Tax=Aphanomyces astaci TaxID=112090 RepID=W4GW53_APHAT|nr:hypothetical protein H257_04030 [Aphanomyces astaci]ETV83259.1 hypothetical protein H257_04030 [Aphanomyces astaci]|eukprot:XP_009826689.1 hypothetical protein H257_04030 [Aphanomyces astaci]
MNELRREVLHVYKACLVSASKCPQHVHRETMRAYARLKFRDKMHLRDVQAVKLCLADAKEELERMDYYHSMYRAGQADKVTASSVGVPVLASHCPNCNHSFESAVMRFCALCGVQRPNIVS